MNTFNNNSQPASRKLTQTSAVEKAETARNGVFGELENSIYAALETYSNVHRGSGHFSQVTTYLYEKAREIVLDFLTLKKSTHTVIFCSTLRLQALVKVLKPGSFKILKSSDFGLHLGVAALAVRKASLPLGMPPERGGGTTKLYGTDWVIWTNSPDKFEAGTPAIINIIAFAKALLMIRQHGNDIFRKVPDNLSDTRILLYENEFNNTSGKELRSELRNSLIGSDVMVPTTRGIQSFINFDNSASTQTFIPVWNAFRNTLRQPESVRKAIINEATQICSEMMGAPLVDYEIVFSSNTTESINLAAQNLVCKFADSIDPVILTTTLEHSSNDLPWRTVNGHSLIRLAVDNDGFFNLSELETLLKSYNKENQHNNKRIVLLAVTGASNVLGSCSNLAEIGKITRLYGVSLLVDAAQLVAHRKIEMATSGIDCLAFSGHKVYAPFGAGLLIFRKGMIKFSEAKSELMNSFALENAAGIAALGKALVLLNRIGFDVIEEEEKKLTGKALREMSGIPGLKVHGATMEKSEALINKIGVIGFEFKGKMSSKIAGKLARDGGIGVRYGCLCAHLIIKQLAGFTPFMEKFQRFVLKLLPILNLQGISRVSFGIQNTEAELDVLISELKQIAGVSGVQEYINNPDRGTGSKSAASEKEIRQQMKDFIRTREDLVFKEINT